jgi:hypothetical protein
MSRVGPNSQPDGGKSQYVLFLSPFSLLWLTWSPLYLFSRPFTQWTLPRLWLNRLRPPYTLTTICTPTTSLFFLRLFLFSSLIAGYLLLDWMSSKVTSSWQRYRPSDMSGSTRRPCRLREEGWKKRRMVPFG